LLHVLFVLKIEGIFGNSKSQPKIAKKIFFIFIFLVLEGVVIYWN